MFNFFSKQAAFKKMVNNKKLLKSTRDLDNLSQGSKILGK